MIFLILILLPLSVFFCAILVADKIERRKKKQKSSTPISPEWIAAMQKLDELDYIIGVGPKPERITRMKAQLQKLVVRRKILSERKARLTKERHQVA